MIELIQITNDPAFARRCDALPGMRVFVDLEWMGKAERQAGRNTFISLHRIDDVARIRDALRNTPLMVRVNPLHGGSADEVEAVLALGADSVMLPMFRGAAQLSTFCGLVRGRVPVVALLETAAALHALDAWIATPGVGEVFVGLNDLHLSLQLPFMFQPLAQGMVDQVAQAVQARGLPFGFGGIARLGEGLLPGRDVLAEHLRLGSGSVILSRTFHRGDGAAVFEREVEALRACERLLALRNAQQVEADRVRIAAAVEAIAAEMPPRP